MSSKELLVRLPDVDDVRPRSQGADACIQAVRRVLEEYGALDRFGLTLLHEHFELADDEVMMEYVDAATRTLTTRPVKQTDDLVTKSIETSWRLDTQTALQQCEKYCAKPYGENGPHTGGHATTG